MKETGGHLLSHCVRPVDCGTCLHGNRQRFQSVSVTSRRWSPTLRDWVSTLSHIQTWDSALYPQCFTSFSCLTIPLILYTRQNYKDFWALMRRTCRSAEITACHSHKQTVLLYTDIISIHYIWGPAQLIFIIKHWHDDYLNDFTNTFIRILSAVLLMCLSVLYVVCLYLSVKVRLQSGLTQKPTLI